MQSASPVPVLDKGHRISSAIKESPLLRPLRQSDVYADGRVLINPRTGEIMEAVLASRPIFKRLGGVEPRRSGKQGVEISVEEGETTQKSNSADGRAAARARRQVFHLAACNDFDLFFTLTLNPQRLDRYDYKAAVRKLSTWLSNRVQREGLCYVAVPELHKDGALHFHGLCNAEGVRLLDSGRAWRGRTVYNLDWGWGFSTAVKLEGSYDAACKYIAKYVTKAAGGRTICGRYYYHGGALATPHVQHFQGSGAPLSGKPVCIEEAGLTLLYIDLNSPENRQVLGGLLADASRKEKT